MGTRRGYAKAWLWRALTDAWHHLRREGIVLTLSFTAAGAVIAWDHAAHVPVHWFYTRWPWQVYSDAPVHVTVGNVAWPSAIVALIVFGGYYSFAFIAAPYRMMKERPMTLDTGKVDPARTAMLVQLDRLVVQGRFLEARCADEGRSSETEAFRRDAEKWGEQVSSVLGDYPEYQAQFNSQPPLADYAGLGNYRASRMVRHRVKMLSIIVESLRR